MVDEELKYDIQKATANAALLSESELWTLRCKHKEALVMRFLRTAAACTLRDIAQRALLEVPEEDSYTLQQWYSNLFFSYPQM
jgi:hypothetical protein